MILFLDSMCPYTDARITAFIEYALSRETDEVEAIITYLFHKAVRRNDYEEYVQECQESAIRLWSASYEHILARYLSYDHVFNFESMRKKGVSFSQRKSFNIASNNNVFKRWHDAYEGDVESGDVGGREQRSLSRGSCTSSESNSSNSNDDEYCGSEDSFEPLSVAFAASGEEYSYEQVEVVVDMDSGGRIGHAQKQDEDFRFEWDEGSVNLKMANTFSKPELVLADKHKQNEALLLKRQQSREKMRMSSR